MAECAICGKDATRQETLAVLEPSILDPNIPSEKKLKEYAVDFCPSCWERVAVPTGPFSMGCHIESPDGKDE